MASWIDVSMLGVPDYEAASKDGIEGCYDNHTGESIDAGLGCYRRIKPLSPEAMAIWAEVEKALNQKIAADWPNPDDCDLGMGWNNSFQS